MYEIVDILKELYPFNFLTRSERELIALHTKKRVFHKDDVLVHYGDSKNKSIYVMTSGSVKVIGKHNEKIGTIDSPSYFGEWSVLFNQERKSTIKASEPVICFQIKGEVIVDIILKNQSFSHAFASTLRNKQKIFENYDKFITEIINCKTKGFLALSEIAETYKYLTPLLHQHINSIQIDFDALKYVLGRLPADTTSTSDFFLAQNLPKIYQEIFKTDESLFVRTRKKYTLNILPGKIMIVLRDEISDYIDFITKLCVYYHETQKIITRLKENQDIIREITSWYLKNDGGKQAIDDENIIEQLPFTNKEKKALVKQFPNQVIRKLYEIIAQNSDVNIHIHEPTLRYHVAAEEIWLQDLRAAISSVIPQECNFEQIKFHVISSNIHSVNNSLSSWMRDNKEEVLQWAIENYTEELTTINNEDDRFYYIAKKWFKCFPEKFAERKKADFAEGIVYLKDSSLTGMDVSVIYLSKLQQRCDGLISMPDAEKLKHNIIINMDYAYGKQAEVSMRNLILLLSHQIKTISILGKAGGTHGERGDIFIPEDVIVQSNDNLYPVINANLQAKDFQNIGWEKGVHTGTMLTVLGTLMQNSEMLKFYRLFWNVLALDMESGYYLAEIDKAFFHNHLNKDIKLHMAYYISDTPLSPEDNLSKTMSPEEGVPAVYCITRTILNRIFALINEHYEN